MKIKLKGPTELDLSVLGEEATLSSEGNVVITFDAVEQFLKLMRENEELSEIVEELYTISESEVLK